MIRLWKCCIGKINCEWQSKTFDIASSHETSVEIHRFSFKR
jgi:hypothetical protein